MFYLLFFFNDTSTHEKKKCQDHVDDQMTSKEFKKINYGGAKRENPTL